MTRPVSARAMSPLDADKKTPDVTAESTDLKKPESDDLVADIQAHRLKRPSEDLQRMLENLGKIASKADSLDNRVDQLEVSSVTAQKYC